MSWCVYIHIHLHIHVSLLTEVNNVAIEFLAQVCKVNKQPYWTPLAYWNLIFFFLFEDLSKPKLLFDIFCLSPNFCLKHLSKSKLLFEHFSKSKLLFETFCLSLSFCFKHLSKPKLLFEKMF